MLLLPFAFERFHDFRVVASDKRATRMNGEWPEPIPDSILNRIIKKESRSRMCSEARTRGTGAGEGAMW